MTRIKIFESLERVITLNNLLKNAYLWKPPITASARREKEKFYEVPRFEFEFDGKSYSVSLNVSCSCNHVYVYRDYRRDGDKVDIRVIKNVYNKMLDEYLMEGSEKK